MGGLLHLIQRGGASPLLAVPNVTAHPSTVSVPSSYYLCGTWRMSLKHSLRQQSFIFYFSLSDADFGPTPILSKISRHNMSIIANLFWESHDDSCNHLLHYPASAPGLQIYLRPRVILISDLLNTKVDRFMPLVPGPIGQLASSQFIHYQNIVFTSLVTDERTNRRTDWEHYASDWQSGVTEAD